MTLKTCGCGKHLTTRNISKPKKTVWVLPSGLKKMLWFNCQSCNSTLTLTKLVGAK